MTISAFANQHRQMADWAHVPVRRAYRDARRADARARQEAFDADVARVARDQNVSAREAHRVVVARRRFEHRLASR